MATTSGFRYSLSRSLSKQEAYRNRSATLRRQGHSMALSALPPTCKDEADMLLSLQMALKCADLGVSELPTHLFANMAELHGSMWLSPVLKR
jgi:hypothetical protein